MMAYASVSRLRELTNFKRELLDNNEVQVLIPLADRILNKLITTRHHLEVMSGTIDGSNKFFRVKHPPLADTNLGNVTLIDSCDVATGWTKGGDGGDPAVAGALVQGSHCVSLSMTGTSTTSASFTKTVTSVDGTGKRLRVSIYIKDPNELAEASALTIRIGSAADKYYVRVFRREELHAGINEFDMLITDMGLSGVPVIAALVNVFIDFSVPTTADTVAAGNVMMDYWRLEDPSELDITDVDVFYATLDTDSKRVYGSRQTLTATNRREGRVTVNTAPTSTTAAEGIFANYSSIVEGIDYSLVKDAACYVLAHLCSFKIAGQAPDFAGTEDAFLRRDIAGAPDEWLRLAITAINLALGSQQIGLRNVKTKDVLE